MRFYDDKLPDKKHKSPDKKKNWVKDYIQEVKIAGVKLTPRAKHVSAEG